MSGGRKKHMKKSNSAKHHRRKSKVKELRQSLIAIEKERDNLRQLLEQERKQFRLEQEEIFKQERKAWKQETISGGTTKAKNWLSENSKWKDYYRNLGMKEEEFDDPKIINGVVEKTIISIVSDAMNTFDSDQTSEQAIQKIQSTISQRAPPPPRLPVQLLFTNPKPLKITPKKTKEVQQEETPKPTDLSSILLQQIAARRESVTGAKSLTNSGDIEDWSQESDSEELDDDNESE